MDEIDCSSGGGQLARTAVSLSAVLGKPVRLFNIRKTRPKPGLKAQHLAGLDAVRELCEGSRLDGAAIGSESIEFHPGKIRGGRHLKVNIPTAGSIGLVLQSVLLPSFFAKNPVELEINGGSTASSWSPPVEYVQNVFLPLLAGFGCSARLNIIKRGYYPAGGAEVGAMIEPTSGSLKPISILGNCGAKGVAGIVHSSKSLEPGRVGERIETSARKAVFDRLGREAKIKLEYSQTASPGCGIVLWADCEKSVIGADVLGERGKKAEDVGRECVQKLAAELAGSVDSHAGDMLIPYMAIASGESSIRVPRITEHMRANIALTEKIAGVKFSVDEKSTVISVDGLSLTRT